MAVGTTSGGGRALLVTGSAVLLASLLLPLPPLTWFTLSGATRELPVGTYTGVQITGLLASLVEGPFALIGVLAWAGLALLFVSATAAIAVAGMARGTRHIGTLGLLILLLYAGVLYLTAYRLNLPLIGSDAAVSIGYGFVAAVLGCALIEAGGRLPRAVPMRRPVPSASYRRESP